MIKATNLYIICLVYVLSLTGSIAQDLEELAKAFGVLPEIRNVRVSPDGTRLMMIREIDDKSVIVTRDLNDPDKSPNGIPMSEGHILSAEWANDDKLVATVGRPRFLHLSNLRLANSYDRYGGAELLVDWQGDSASNMKLRKSVVDMFYKDKDRILVRDGERIFWHDLNTSEEERILMGPIGAYGPLYMDKNDNIRYIEGNGNSIWSFQVTGDGFYRKTAGSEWIKTHDFSIRGSKNTAFREVLENLIDFVGFTDDPNLIYVLAHDENGKNALFKFDVNKKAKVEKILWHDKYDITSVKIDDNYDIDAYYFNGEKPTMVAVSEKYQRLKRIFNQSLPGSTIDIINHSEDEKIYVVKARSPRDPGTYYLLDLNNNSLVMIGYNYQNVDVEQLATMTPVSFAARDGLNIPAYITLPQGKELSNLPVVILPRREFAGRISWDFDYRAQHIASLGYAVFQIDYRGTFGYGLDYIQNGLFDLGTKVIDDINDGTKWLIDQGIADPDRICIVGHNFSGYAALQASIAEDSLYKCVVVTDPVINFKRYFNDFVDAYLESININEEDVSPYHNYKKIKAAILFIDEQQKYSRDEFELEKFIENLRENGNVAEHYVVENLFANNRSSKLLETANFLRKYLH